MCTILPNFPHTTTQISCYRLFQTGYNCFVTKKTCKVFVILPRTVKNSAIIGKYKELVGTVYSEPEDDSTVGWCEDDNDEIHLPSKTRFVFINKKLKSASQFNIRSPQQAKRIYVTFLRESAVRHWKKPREKFYGGDFRK